MSLSLAGTFRLTVRDRLTGEVKDVREMKNTLATDGKNMFIDRVVGAGVNPLSQTYASLKINYSGGPKYINGAYSAPNHSTEFAVTYAWQDSSQDTYTPTSVQVQRYVNPTRTDFNEQTSVSWGTKGINDTWDIEYTLSLGSADAHFVDLLGSGLTFPGMDYMLRMLSGTEAHAFDTTETCLTVKNSGGTVELNQIAPDTAHRISNFTMEWIWVVAPGASSRDWYDVEVGVYVSGSPDVYKGLRRDPSEQNGIQGISTTRTYKYQIQVS